MAKDGDMSLFNDVLEPFRRVINTDSPKDKLSASTKLDFSDNQSLREDVWNLLAGAKRKSSIGHNESTPDKRMRTNSDSFNKSATPPASPWEAKKLKIDLIGAKAQIVKLEARVNQQHILRKEMEILFEGERASLQEQHKRDEQALSSMEDRMAVIRRREQEMKEDHSMTVKEHKDAKAHWDKQKTELQNQIADLKDKLLEATVSGKDQLSEMKKDMNELLQALEAAQSEVEILKKEVAWQTSRGEQCSVFRTQVEKQTFELQQATNRIKELEYERDLCQDWQAHSKTAQKRLSNMADLEKEVVRLRASDRSLRDSVQNKILLEERVNQLNSRVKAMQPVQDELHEARVKLATLESALEEWQSTARAHGVESALSLSTALASALTSELTATAASSQATNQVSQLTEEVNSVKFERDKATRKLNDLLNVRKNQESLIHRLQKRLLLVTRERDSYRQQLDCYEKELTVTLCGETGAGSTALLSARVEQLETALQGYRDALAGADGAAHAREAETLRTEMTKWREETETLRRELQKVRAQRDSLQAHIHRIGVAAVGNGKILHLVDNPAAEAEKQIHQELDAAREEIKKLKAACLEGGSKVCTDESQQLKQQLDSSRIKIKRMKEEFTSSAQEYRDVVYMLLGYKIDRTGHKNYRISNMYAESPEEYLTFTLSDDGIEMVHTEYSATLGELVELHLLQHRSIPLFLCGLTVQLFNRTTMQQMIE